MDIPPLEASLYKISQLPPTTGNGSNGCNHMGSNGIYNCLRPNSYIQLSGDSHVNFSFAHDHVGEDSNTQHTFLNANNGFGYGLRNTGPLTRTETCVARNVTPLVEFPAITAAQLQQGQNIQANFNVTLECSDHVQSGTNSNQTAIAFELSNDAYITALNLGLGLENGAIKYLLSDQYQSNAELAQGVGIRLNHSISHEEMFFVRPSAGLETGGNAGWHPVLEGSSRIGRVQSGHSSYLQLYTATLEALPGKTVTPGKIKATATVVVKIQ